MRGSPAVVNILHGTVIRPPFPDDYFDAVFTGPPYYDDVPYSDLLEAGLDITASWPVRTTMQSRLRAQEMAALASSIYDKICAMIDARHRACLRAARRQAIATSRQDKRNWTFKEALNDHETMDASDHSP